MTRGAPPDWLAAILVCPSCHGALSPLSELFLCKECGARFEQHDPRAIDLLPPDLPRRDPSRWQERQKEMTRSYGELLTDREQAILGFRNDYTPCAPLLGSYSGRILDLGGGPGVTRHFLSPGVDYVVLDPSPEWLDPRWRDMATEFPCLTELPDFTLGVAEKLPFGQGSFDAVLLLWSLNHVSDPRAALREVARVLRPGGRALLVLEDMPPRWRDIVQGSYPHDRAQLRAAVAQKMRSVFVGWPLQSDHIRIRERPLMRWAAPELEVARRAWLGAYLALELLKKDRRS